MSKHRSFPLFLPFFLPYLSLSLFLSFSLSKLLSILGHFFARVPNYELSNVESLAPFPKLISESLLQYLQQTQNIYSYFAIDYARTGKERI
jgi:hypothetical protein